MMTAIRSLSILATLTGAALAADVKSIMQHARTIEADATQINLALKSKKFDTGDLKSKIDATHANFNDLKQAVSDFEAANPSSANTTEWKAVKDRVELLGIFLNRKSELASDAHRNRGMLRAHAKSVIKRAADLQQTASRLQSSSTTASGS